MEDSMALTYHKAESTSLADAGFDEKWLQERILNDTSILGLGEINVLQHEKKQSSGGRIDFLMYDPEINMMYEVEVMLGKLDESHIIRTIEYWDIERRRWANREHRAVIVAEEITNRFFNVIALFNRAIPIIAIQLSALKVDGKIILNFTKVLDIYESPENDGGPEPDPVDRKYWDNLTKPESMKIVDQLLSITTVNGKSPKLSYRRGDIVMGGSKKHFCWLNPRKSQARCLVYLKVLELDIQATVDKLEEAGINAIRNKDDIIRIVITPDDLKKGEAVIRDVFTTALKNVGGEIE
jgi:hypothetical protein